MDTLDTDYLVIGAGAVGLAFADTLLAESDATMLIVDRHGLPGGHWNDAYPFVALHQPSAFYGVPSLPLGSGRIDHSGPNAGLMELASGAEVLAHFQHAMQRQLLPSGRVSYRPMSEVRSAGGVHQVTSLLSGETVEVHVRRRVVDATYFGSSVPSTHTPAFAVEGTARLLTPNQLPHLWRLPGDPPRHFVILGGGKTAMDTVVWLLACGALPEQVTWVRPRESWLIDRRTTQPTMAHFEAVMGSQVALLEALAQATTADELFERQEAAGAMLRIDPSSRPTMFHYATISAHELAQLRRIEQVIRRGRVQAITADALVFADQRVPVPAGSVFVDCTASAVERRPTVPVFQDGRLVLQMVRIPQPAFSAALVAHLEASDLDDAARNAMTAPVPLPDGLDGYARATLVGLMNQMRWGQDKALRAWIRDCRLDGFGRLVAEVDRADTAKTALLDRLKAAGPSVMAAAPRWMAQAAQSPRA
jgi:predicted metal-dependent enzyme (double-stranded beta helix superfamily)